jgi:prepilin-type N-terminal cleavage/methylation domain-containing protein
MSYGSPPERGFTALEVACVAVILGVVGALATPGFRASTERLHAEKGFHYLEVVYMAQEEFRAREGHYAHSFEELAVNLPFLVHFVAMPMEYFDPETRRKHWSLTIVRRGAPAKYGCYTIVFNQDGFDEEKSTLSQFPDINPFDTRVSRITHGLRRP